MADEFDEVVDGEAQELADGDSARGSKAEELPAIAEVRALDRPGAAAVPVVQAAALAATGFVAGAAAGAGRDGAPAWRGGAHLTGCR